MSATRTHLMSVASSQLGIKESPRGSNRTKYSKAYGLTGPWCAMFIWWIVREAGGGDLRKTLTSGMASCQAILTALRRKGLLKSKAAGQPGDVALFQFDGDPAPDHIELIIERVIRSGKLWGYVTIGGNTSSTTAGSQSNGGMVARRLRPLGSIVATGSLPGVGGTATPMRPAPTSSPTPKPPANAAMVKLARDLASARRTMVGDGQTNTTNAVKFVQTALKVSADGKWGPQTKAALKKYQRAHGLVADGVVGPATWSSLYPK